MKHINSYRNRLKEQIYPKVGDFVICKEKDLGDPVVTEYVNSHIEKVITLMHSYMHSYTNSLNDKDYIIKFENVPKELNIKFRLDCCDINQKDIWY